MTLKELIERKNKLVDEAEEILAGEELSDEDYQKAKDLTDEAKSLTKRIADMRELAEIKNQHDDYEPTRPPLPGAGGGTMPQPEGGEEPESPEERTRKAYHSFFNMRFGAPEESIKAIIKDAYGSVDRWMNLRVEQTEMFNRYLRDYRWSPYGEDEKLLKRTVLAPWEIKQAISKGATFKQIKATMVEADDLLGGYAVPADYRNQIIDRIAATARIRPLTNQMETSRDIVQIPKSTGGDEQYSSNVRITWVDETPASGAAETNLTFGLEQIPVNTAMATTPISRNLVEDGSFDLPGYLVEKFGESFAINEDNQFVNGDGVGKPEGILQDGSNGLGITEVNSGAAADVQWFDTADSSQGLIAVTFGIAAQYRENARWLFNRDTARNIAALDDAENRPYWSQEQIGEGMLLRYPYLEHEAMPNIAASAYPIIFGDFRGYTVVDRVGMTVERYLDSSTAETNTVKYVARRRVGGRCTEPWRFVVNLISA